MPLASYQNAISPPAMKGPATNDEKLGGESADPTYGGYPKGYPAYAPGGGEGGATLPVGIGGYPSIPPTAPEIPEWENNGPQNTQPNSHIYPNLREFLLKSNLVCGSSWTKFFFGRSSILSKIYSQFKFP